MGRAGPQTILNSIAVPNRPIRLMLSITSYSPWFSFHLSSLKDCCKFPVSSLMEDLSDKTVKRFQRFGLSECFCSSPWKVKLGFSSRKLACLARSETGYDTDIASDRKYFPKNANGMAGIPGDLYIQGEIT